MSASRDDTPERDDQEEEMVDAHPIAKTLLVLAPFVLGGLVVLAMRLIAG